MGLRGAAAVVRRTASGLRPTCIVRIRGQYIDPSSFMRLAATVILCVAAALAAPAALAQTLPSAVPAERATAVPAEPLAADQVAQLLRERKPAEALARADTRLKENPRDAQVRFMRAVALTDLKRTDEAIAAFEAMNQEFPELPEPYNNLAVLLAAQGRYEQARVLLLRSLDAQPGYSTALENLGDLYIAMAADAYQRANGRNPNDRVVQAKLALARDTDGKLRTIR
jgi:Flp pilus assembly protein TadD